MTTQTSAQTMEFPRPAATENNIPIVFAANNHYTPYLGVVMTSIMHNANPAHMYDFMVLETGITETTKDKLRANLDGFDNVSLRFINPSALTRDVSFYLPGYYSEETYYRLFIQTIFQHYNKLVYMDADTIVRHDLSELYHGTDVDGYLFAAALNAGTIPYALNNWAIDGFPWREYLDNTLQLKDVYSYFQAGVLVINVDELKAFDLQTKSLERLSRISPRYVDQDILNSVCQGRVKKLSLQWNFLNVFREDWNSVENIRCLREEDRLDYIKAKENPYIIHFAGSSRAWEWPSLLHAEYWWHYARQSLFYEDIIFRSTIGQFSRILSERAPDPAKKASRMARLACRATYMRYKIMSIVTTGVKRNRYHEKRLTAKDTLKKLAQG